MSISRAEKGLPVVFVCLALLVPSCGDDESAGSDAGADASSDTGADASSDTGGDVAAEVVLAGVARRTAGVTLVGDGIGTLCAAVVAECPMPDDLSVTPVVGGLSVADADLSEETSSVDFRFEIDPSDLPDGTYALFGSLRESGGVCEGDPSPGDLVSVTLLGGASCPELVVTGSGELSGLEIYLNAVVP